MYYLERGSQVPGNTKLIRLGYPIIEDMRPNICICTSSSPYIYIPINANILRSALLANIDITRKLLNIEVSDSTKTQEPQENPKEVSSETKEEQPIKKTRKKKEDIQQ